MLKNHNGIQYRNHKKKRLRKAKQYYQDNKERVRFSNIYSHYNMTVDTYKKLLVLQENRCAICKTEDSGNRMWHVDHDHGCCPMSAYSCGGCVRGLLCGKCNVALGVFSSPQVLSNAIDYLQNTPMRKIEPSHRVQDDIVI